MEIRHISSRVSEEEPCATETIIWPPLEDEALLARVATFAERFGRLMHNGWPVEAREINNSNKQAIGLTKLHRDCTVAETGTKAEKAKHDPGLASVANYLVENAMRALHIPVETEK